MLGIIRSLNPVLQALLAGIFTWLVTALGASFVFVIKNVNQKVLDALFGFAGGIMLSASFWSLLAMAIEMSKGFVLGSWFPATLGFILGVIFLRFMDKIIPHLHIGYPQEEAEGISTSWQKTTLLVMAITLHNIPEGLAVGVAFGAIKAGLSESYFLSAIALAIGIGIQNFPEGFSVALPLRREGLSRIKSFWYGQLSAIVEPICAVLGALAVFWIRPLLPYALAFAAGAMIFVVVEEVIPESQRSGHTDLATTGFMLGFLVMMILDVAFK